MRSHDSTFFDNADAARTCLCRRLVDVSSIVTMTHMMIYIVSRFRLLQGHREAPGNIRVTFQGDAAYAHKRIDRHPFGTRRALPHWKIPRQSLPSSSTTHPHLFRQGMVIGALSDEDSSTRRRNKIGST